MRTHTKETTGIQDTTSPNHPVQDASSKQQTKQKYKPSHQQTGLPPHSALPIRGKTNKNSAQISPYIKLTQATGPTLGGQKPKERKNSTFFKERNQLSLKPEKKRPQTQYLRKNNEKAEKYCTNEGTNWKHGSPNKWRGHMQIT